MKRRPYLIVALLVIAVVSTATLVLDLEDRASANQYGRRGVLILLHTARF